MYLNNMVPFFILLAVLIYLIYEEVRFLSLYFRFKKNDSKTAIAEVSGIVRPPRGIPIFHVKLIDKPSSNHSIKLKTTILSSIIVRLLGNRFRVFVEEKNSFCIVYNPLSFLFSWVVLAAFLFLITRLYDGISA